MGTVLRLVYMFVFFVIYLFHFISTPWPFRWIIFLYVTLRHELLFGAFLAGLVDLLYFHMYFFSFFCSSWEDLLSGGPTYFGIEFFFLYVCVL